MFPIPNCFCRLFCLHSTTPQVMVVTSEGIFYSYAIDLEHGGECVLQKSYSLLDGMGDDPPSASVGAGSGGGRGNGFR